MLNNYLIEKAANGGPFCLLQYDEDSKESQQLEWLFTLSQSPESELRVYENYSLYRKVISDINPENYFVIETIVLENGESYTLLQKVRKTVVCSEFLIRDDRVFSNGEISVQGEECNVENFTDCLDEISHLCAMREEIQSCCEV